MIMLRFCVVVFAKLQRIEQKDKRPTGFNL